MRIRHLLLALALLGAVACVATSSNTPSNTNTASPEPRVARVWRGQVAPARANEYEAYLREGVKKIRTIRGNLGAQVMRRDMADRTEFVVTSYWSSRDEIRAYAGEDIEKVRHLPRDKEYLIDPDEHVRHYDILEAR